MKNFKLCIWFTPDFSNPIHRYTNGFPAHVTLKSNLDYSKALMLFTKIKKKELNVEFDYTVRSIEDNFHSLFYTIKDPKNKPGWWPKNAHMSFLYKYNQYICKSEETNLQNNLNIKRVALKNIFLVNCSGHYSKWKILLSK